MALPSSLWDVMRTCALGKLEIWPSLGVRSDEFITAMI